MIKIIGTTLLSCIFAISVHSESPTWQHSSGKLPYGARWVGMEEKTKDGKILQMAICRGEYEENIFPGRFTRGKCSIAYEGQEILLDKFEIFIHKNVVEFIKLKDLKPGKAIPSGGKLSDISYICVTKFKSNWYPGRLDGDSCRFGYNGDEIKSSISVHVLIQSD